jgi:predicted  nucleic acid-binding Zn-ribbon protein
VIPETSTVEVRNGIVHWTNTDFRISKEQAEALAAEVRDAMAEWSVDAILVDNEEASGTWPQEADETWAELMAEIYENGYKCATISPSATNAMHINRLSKKNDTYDKIKAFPSNERQDAEEFVGVTIQQA